MSRELNDDEREFLKRRELFTALVASPGWKELEKILIAQRDAQIQMLMQAISPGTDGIAKVLETEYRKGTAFGIGLTLTTPYATIKEAESILATTQSKGTSNERHSRNADSYSVDLPNGAIVTELG